MIIQRIEHNETRMGVYRSNPGRDIVSQHDWIAFPGPKSDQQLRDQWFDVVNSAGWLFGFANDHQFLRWRDYGRDVLDGLKRLTEAGYIRAYYDASDVLTGHSQIVFQVRTAIRLRTVSLVDWPTKQSPGLAQFTFSPEDFSTNLYLTNIGGRNDQC